MSQQPSRFRPPANPSDARLPTPASRSRKQRLGQSLRLSVLEGVMAEVVGACAGTVVLTAWALHLKASPLVLGLLVSLSQLAQFIQLPAAWVTSTFGSRKTALIAVAASRQVLLPLAALPFLAVSAGAQQRLLIAVAGLSALLAVIGNNAWVAWMGDLVPTRIRGRYFGRRTSICTAASAVGSLIAGTMLDLGRAHHVESWMLSILTLIAALTGAVSTWLMWRQGAAQPPHEPRRIEWSHVWAPWRDPRARPLLAYQFAWNAAVGLAGSFFSIFMVENLGMGFALLAAQGALAAAVRVLAAPLWGRMIDRFGARPVLECCSFAIALLPLLWLLASPERLWPVWIDPFLAGVFWCGQAQAIFQLPLTLAPSGERPFYLAAFAMTAGLAFAAATGVAGVFATRWTAGCVVFGHRLVGYQLLFAASGIARGAAALLVRRIAEPGARPTRALIQELSRGSRRLGAEWAPAPDAEP